MQDTLKKLEQRIDRFCTNRVNHFSATISPAPKSKERNEIESIAEALLYFASRGVKEVTIQPKYMGSYCDIYLHRNIEDSYFVSRNGYSIRHLDLDLAKKKCEALHQKLQNLWDADAEMVLIQSELMPWSALGKGLVDREFGGYGFSHETHQQFLAKSDMYEKLEKVRASASFVEYENDVKVLKAKQLAEKYKPHVIRQYDAVLNMPILNLDEYASDVRLYQSQVELYGAEAELYFKPFNVLKVCYKNGQEEIWNDNIRGFEAVSEDTQLVLNLDDMELACAESYAFFEQLVAAQHEGVMIKPRTCFDPNLPPAFKVRNNDYLQMIYGINFRKDYEDYLQKRSIRRKLECSIKDWQLSYDMLRVPNHSINTENYRLKLLCYKRIVQENMEIDLDKRL